jgi:aminopeptidase N
MKEHQPLLPTNQTPKKGKFFKLLFWVLSLVAISSLYLHQARKSPHDWTDIRLPDWITPDHYQLTIETDLNTFSFGGKVLISLDLHKRSSFIVVHQKDLDVQFESFIPADETMDVVYSHSEYRPGEEYMILFFKKPLKVGKYALELEFTGKLNTNMAGYYLATFKNETGTHFMATTQFESTSARLAFPCLDEPDKKATFDINMVVHKGYHALSNMPIHSVHEIDGKSMYAFDRTVRMSTYLVAFIVSDFESISSHTDNGIQVNVWTAPGQTHLGEYALQIGVKAIEFYQKKYGIDFPLPKMDMVAVPDFAAGAMENWGLITYRDTALLYDPKKSTAGSKQRVAVVICHELSHQWFGNLVTMKWWQDLWLNEGFAEFTEYKAADFVEPDWQMLEQYISLDLVRALHADESYYTHQIAVNVKNPDEISAIFDDISYAKGSAILRMLEAWMDEKYGEGVFFDKLHNYLTKHAYQNAETSDLWAALRTEDQDVGKFMATWTDQPGFPFLTFDELGTKSVSVRQERFLFAHLIKVDEPKDVMQQLGAKDPKKQIWSVPLSYAVYSNSTGSPQRLGRGFTEVSTLGDVRVEFEKEFPSDSILLANFAQTGVYRSLYDQKTYRYLVDWLKNDLEFLPAVERGGLISDVFSMTFSGRLQDPTIALELVQILRKDTNILVWDAALKDLESLKDTFALYPTYGPLIEFQNSLIEKIVNSIGWVESSADVHSHHVRALLRGRLLAEAVRNNHGPTVATALEYFDLVKNGKRDQIPVSSEVLGAIYDAGVIYGDLDDYNFIMNKFKKSTFAPDQQLYLHALASSHTPYLQARTLAFAISGQVRKQDIQTLIRQVATLSPVGHISTWLFLLDNWY